MLDYVDGLPFLLDGQGQLLFSESADQDVSAALTGQVYDPARHVLPIESGGVGYSVVYQTSQSADLIYGVAVPERAYMNQVVSQVGMIRRVVLLALLLCLVAAAVLAFLNYLPLKRLLDQTGISVHGSADEYHELGTAIRASRDRVDELTSTVEAQKPYVLERLLGYMLGTQMPAKDALTLFSGMDLRFGHDRFFVICCRALLPEAQPGGNSSFKAAVIEGADRMCSAHAHCYCVERIGDSRMIIVVNCQPTLDRVAFCERIRDQLQAHTRAGYRFVLGVGGMESGLERLKTSLYEANVLVEYGTGKSIAYSEEIERLPGGFYNLYPAKDMMLLLEQVREGDEQTAMDSLARICSQIERSVDSQRIARHIYGQIAEALTVAVRQAAGDRFKDPLAALHAGIDSGGFEAAAGALIEGFCRFVSEDKHNSGSRLRAAIMAYVDEHFEDGELSLERVAEAFNLSTYYISRFFRDQSDMNFKDYVASKRIEKAKQLLVDTQRPVGEIVGNVGYLSASSFIQKFKAATGLTPGQYRERYRCDQNA